MSPTTNSKMDAWPFTTEYTEQQARAVAHTLSHACFSVLHHQPENTTVKSILQQTTPLCTGLLEEQKKGMCKSKISLSIRYLMRKYYKELYWQDRQKLRESYHILQRSYKMR